MPCPDPSGSCWFIAPRSGKAAWQKTPLHSPIFLYGADVLFPCGGNAFLRWCQWRPAASEPPRAFPPIHAPQQTDPQRLMPRAWGPPWLLMGEEAPCDAGTGEKIWSVDRAYWLVNLTTGLPSRWKVWQAIKATPRCLAEGDSLEGYVQIDIIGWNPTRPDELAFAVRRFPAASYERALDDYPFRTEIYLWHTNGSFVKVGAFSRLACGLWAPDGSGWLCAHLGEGGQPQAEFFITREGNLAAQATLPPGVAILQWVP